MKYKSSDGNIYSSDNLDPEFLTYLYSLPPEFLEELFMSWVMVKNNQQSIPVIDIDAIYENKTDPFTITINGKRITNNSITNKEIKDFYNYLKSNKIDISKVNNKGESNE